MSFRDFFPWTYALWRFLSSKPVRITLLSLGILLFFLSVGFRIESLLFQRNVDSLLERMSELRLDDTSEEELLRLLPELAPSKVSSQQSPINAKRYAAKTDDLENGILVRYVWRLWQNETGIRVLYALGHRFHRFNAFVEVLNGKVVRTHYDLWVDTNEDHGLYDGAGVSVTSVSRAGWRYPGGPKPQNYDDLRPYAEEVASNAPENSLHLIFTPDTPAGFQRSAFYVRLNCLWNAAPCKNSKQLLPAIWPPHYPWIAWGFEHGVLPEF